MAKGFIKVKEVYCKGCGLCVEVCPQGTLRLSNRLTKKGYHPVELREDKCTACASCASVCPEAAITIIREIPASKLKSHIEEKLGTINKDLKNAS
ncbi:MAG: ferredoxin family protein [SAR324 cluster bacterium]|uniref:Ferredoxin family protein n=1 Tax=SAR324 cluster bacterium TaxID=2024889 RepID=A0A7X9FUR9_9DELT|nr:ferredoxin family protein [SAR324 cluster bacterium]